MDKPLIVCNGRANVTLIDHTNKHIEINVLITWPKKEIENKIPEVIEYIRELGNKATDYLQYEGFIPFANPGWTVHSTGVLKNDFQE
jgi:hypothetical protein